MKRYLKLLSLFGLLILLAAPLFNSKEASADANTFCAKSWGQVDSGDFEDNYLDSAKDGGVKFKSLKPKFNTNSKWMQTYSGKINLKERTDGKEHEKEPTDLPYRYWFWLKVNKRANGPPTWYTRGYTGTLEPIPGSNYNAYYHSDCAQVSRIYPKAQKGTFFESIGTSGYYRLCLYVVDIKNWYDKLSKKKPYSGFLYLHSLIRIRNICNYDGPPNPANDKTKGDLTTIDAWKKAADANGFAPAGKATYWKHYNQRINLNTKTYREFKVHKIATTSKHPELGDYTSLGKLDGTKEWKRATAGSIIKFSNIRGHNGKDGNKYYLKGIVVRGPGSRKTLGTDHGHFYILDNYNDNPICGTTKLTRKYSHQNSRYSGKERDSLSGMKYVYDNVIKISYDDRTFSMSRSDTYDTERVHTNKSGKTGEHSWEVLSKHIQDLYVKIPEDRSEIFLIYQKIPQGDVYARKHYREWSDKTEQYEEVDSTKYKEIDKLPKGKAKCSYSIADVPEKKSNAVSPVSEHIDIPYYARKIKMTYTPVGKTKSKEILIDTNDYLNGSGLTSPFWSGKDSEKEALKAVIEKAMKKVKADDVNPLADVKFDIYYYQPKTPTVGLMYYQYYNEEGQANYTLVGATQPKSVHPGSTEKSRYGSIKFENSIRIGKVDNKYVRVTDANQALATEVETVDLTSAKAYLTTVKGYLSEKKNGWGNDRPLTSGE